jgi:hypothetical protein
MRLCLALFLLLAGASARAENPAAAPQPPGLSRSNWDKAVQHARSLNDAVKAQVSRMDWAEDAPQALTQGSGRARRSKSSRLRKFAAPAPAGPIVPAVTTMADLKTLAPVMEPLKDAPNSAPAAKASAFLPMDPLSIHAMPSLDQTLAPLGPEAVAPQTDEARCSDPRARADRRRCPAVPR